MDTKFKNAVKKDVIEWIQALDDEKLLFVLDDIKERNREKTPEEKQEYNQWLATLDYEPQLELLRSVITSSPDRGAIWNELSPEAQENLRIDEETINIDEEDIYEPFWDLVRDLKKGEELSREPLSEAERKSIEQGMADVEAGRTTTHEEVWKKHTQWLNDMKVKQMKEDIPDLPEKTRAEIADFVLQTLNRPGSNEDQV